MVSPETMQLLRRVRARRRQRGAALFIVVMVIVLLTAIGVFAARSASLVDVAAGHTRQATQTQYVSEYGARLSVAEWGSGMASSLATAMDPPINGQTPDTCEATADLATRPAYASANRSPPCYQRTFPEMAAFVDRNFSGQKVLDQYAVGGDPNVPSLGAAPVEGDFRIELTGKFKPFVPIAGVDSAKNELSARRVTITVIGQVRPFTNGANVCVSQSAVAASITRMRTRITVKDSFPTG